MAFDMGFDFRATSSFVVDPPYGVPVLAEAFPNTYTNTNGDSVNAGFDTIVALTYNAVATNDPRIAAINYRSNSGTVYSFKVDLGSGSAPGPGTYSIDMALGEADAATKQDFKLLDSTTVLLDGTNGGLGIATAIGHFIDATLTDVTASSSWTGTPANYTFATSVARLSACYDNVGNNTCWSHFRLTAQSTGTAAATPVRHFMLLGVGV